MDTIEFSGGPLDGHVQKVSLPTSQLNRVVAIPVNRNIIAMLSGHRYESKRPATSIAVYGQQVDTNGTQYQYLRSASPSQFQLTTWRG